MKVIPRKKYVLIKPDDEESKENKFGLLTPSNEETEEKSQGTVEGVGEEVKGIEKGDRVVYGVLAGEDIGIEGVDYKLIYDDDIIAFIK